MIDDRTMSSPVLPVEIWLQISHELDFEGCKKAERLNHSYRELVEDPALAAIRFQETEPDPDRRRALFAHEGLLPRPLRRGRYSKVSHLNDVWPLSHPLFRCVDWSPSATLDSLVLRWNSRGEWLERPIPFRSLVARHEKATSPPVNELAVSFEHCGGVATTTALVLYPDDMPISLVEHPAA